MVQLEWQGELRFSAGSSSGSRFQFDGAAEEGDGRDGPSPMEALLGSLAACAAMDVVSILVKKRQRVTAYRVEVDGGRVPPGTWPRPFLSFTIRHIVTGQQVDPDALARAVQLSDEKYCSVAATLRLRPEIRSEWRIGPQEPRSSPSR